MSDPTWNGTAWVNSGVPSNTVTAAEAPANTDATEVPSNYLICDRTGFRVPVDEALKEEWNGFLVRRQSWEPRNAQDFVRGQSDDIHGSDRPEQDDRFISEVYPAGVQASDL